MLALLYINRVSAGGLVPVTALSWRALWATAVIVAQKTCVPPHPAPV